MIEYKGVKIPSTANDWELYSTMDGAEWAANDLTEAAKKAVDLIADAKLSERVSVQTKALDVIGKAQEKHAGLGACDSEPCYEARHVVIDAMKAIADIDVDPMSL